MMTPEEYSNRLQRLVRVTPVEEVSVVEAVGQCLAEAVRAGVPVPPFDNSSMDGYAVAYRDIAVLAESSTGSVTLPVSGDIPAGAVPRALRGGTAMRIMTGSVLPSGADTVVPVELTDQPPGAGPAPREVTITGHVEQGASIRFTGHDIERGQIVASAGERVTPALLAGVLAAGVARVLVHRRPRVAVIVTGDELTEAGDSLDLGHIPDSNGPMLASLVRQAGADIVQQSRSVDREVEFLSLLSKAASCADLILTTGGVSAGAFEVVKQAMSIETKDADSPRMSFVKVAIQPGKPQGYGSAGGTPIIGLPGNPVSAFTSFHVFVRPFLSALSGGPGMLSTQPVEVGTGWESHQGKAQVMPVSLVPKAVPSHTLGSASHAIASLHRADALALIPLEITQVKPGMIVDAIILEGK
ncbi:gephyrin-like molybdotransferase Glp [Corynebacterium macclintockiae]